MRGFYLLSNMTTMKLQLFRRLLTSIPHKKLYTISSISHFSDTLYYYNTKFLSSISHFQSPVNFNHNYFSKDFCTKLELRKCWNCSSTTHVFLVCDACRCVQPVDHSVDFFRIFGLERKYEIEEGNLESKYKHWQKKLHPDLVHSKSQSEREYAAQQSARVIDAYRTLKNPLSRAIYLMKVKGVHVDEEQTVSDPELLAEVMEIRESVEEAPDTRTLKQIQAEVQKKLVEWSEVFAGAFKSQDTEEALNAIRRMTYYKRANEEIVKRL